MIGYINTRDVLPYRFELSEARTVSAVVRNIHPVPQSKNLMELLRELIGKNCEMALVVDEYGGTAGVVTFQTLVEDFLYFFYPSKTEVKSLGDGQYLFPGNTALDEVAEVLQIEVQSDSRTLSGYIIEKLEDIPAEGTSLSIDGHTMTVTRVSRKKVLEVRIRKN
jgi:CBS domain containing-hemolysin-like protein